MLTEAPVVNLRFCTVKPAQVWASSWAVCLMGTECHDLAHVSFSVSLCCKSIYRSRPSTEATSSQFCGFLVETDNYISSCNGVPECLSWGECEAVVVGNRKGTVTSDVRAERTGKTWWTKDIGIGLEGRARVCRAEERKEDVFRKLWVTGEGRRAGRGSGWRAMVSRLSCIFSGGCEELLF